MDYEEAKKNLVQLSGIGPKVRVLLLSNHLKLLAAKLFFFIYGAVCAFKCSHTQ